MSAAEGARAACMSTPKKKSPSKKKIAVKASYGGISFDKDAAPPTSREEPEDDPLASYRAAAAVASKALEKERQEEAQVRLYKKLFAAMDTDGDGKVELAEVIEAVAAGTAPLSHRAASASRPTGAVTLQLPVTFTLDQWVKEMQRMRAAMDAATFEVNVMGLFDCFKDRAPPTSRPAPTEVDVTDAANATGASGSGGAPGAPSKINRTQVLRELFTMMDDDGDGMIGIDDFLKQAKGSDEADDLRCLFDFFDEAFCGGFGDGAGKLTFVGFCTGTLTKTPLGRLRDDAFASAIRGMKADVARAATIKASAEKRLGLLQTLFKALDVQGKGVVEMNEFMAQAKSNAEADDLKLTFASFDRSLLGSGEDGADGKLTFRKFATGTLQTPLGRLKDEAFEKAVTGMIETVAVASNASTERNEEGAAK